MSLVFLSIISLSYIAIFVIEFVIASLLDGCSVGSPTDTIDIVNIDILDIVLKFKEQGLTLGRQISWVESNEFVFFFASTFLNSIIQIKVVKTMPEPRLDESWNCVVLPVSDSISHNKSF